MAISHINGITAANISHLNGIVKANISAINGVTASFGGGAPSFSDDFNDNSFDTGKWSPSMGTGFSFAETNSQLEISTTTSGDGAGIVFSLSTYSIADKSVTWELPTAPLNGVDTTVRVFCIVINGSNHYVGFELENTTINFRYNDGTNNDTSLTYNSTDHRWLRLVHSTGSNNMLWMTSPDGSTWTTRRTVSTWSSSPNITLSGMTLRCQATQSPPNAARTFIYDNVSIA